MLYAILLHSMINFVVIFMQKTMKNKLRITIIILVSILFNNASFSQNENIPTKEEINAEVVRLMRLEDVKGLAIAVIDNGIIEHVATYGHRNVEKNLPLETDTIMYGASLTKTAFTYMVLQLVDENVFDLDKPLAEYFLKPLTEIDLPKGEDYKDLEGDGRLQKITARHVFTHSTGFANFRWLEDDQKLRFHSDPGKRYAYSAEGFYLLQLALEKGLGLDVKEEMQRRIFDRFDMTNTSMQWRDDFAKNLADGYAIDGTFEPHDERSGISAAGSMDTTIADQANMWRGILAGDGLSKTSRDELVSPQLAIHSSRQFPTFSTKTSTSAQKISLAAGLGLITYKSPNGRLVWTKGGHNPWTGNIVICQEIENRCLVMLANSVRAELIYPQITEFILGNIAAPWWWEYGSK